MRLKVTESEFVKILKEGKFSEKATVLKEWKKMGYLKAQSDRYISQVKIIGDIKVKRIYHTVANFRGQDSKACYSTQENSR